MTLEKLQRRARVVARLYRAQVKRCAALGTAEEFELASKLRAYLQETEGQLRLRTVQARVGGRVTPGSWPPPAKPETRSVLAFPVAAEMQARAGKGNE